MRVIDRLPDVQRATGCTEPAAVALAAALAARAAGGEPWWIAVACDPATFRNGTLAGVPGAAGGAGLDLAAALGALAGDPDRRLDLLATVSPSDVAAARGLVAREGVSVVRREHPRLRIDVRVETDRGTGEVSIRDHHTAVASLLRDGAPWPLPAWAGAGPPAPAPATLAEALALADAVGPEDEAALLAALEVNVTATAAAGCQAAPWSPAAEDVEALASAAARARMTGRRVTVVTSGWSGNQGLVATLPLHALRARRPTTRAALARALATSYLVGALLRDAAPSPLCHALVAASAGAAAGCARLLGGDAAAVERACHLVLASAGAAACDGAKPACALRVGLAAAQAVRCAARACDAADVEDVAGGLVGPTLEETARRIAEASARLAAADARQEAPSCGA